MEDLGLLIYPVIGPLLFVVLFLVALDRRNINNGEKQTYCGVFFTLFLAVISVFLLLAVLSISS